MKVLVTGGAGYIGSHTVLELLRDGHEVVIADNFVNSKPTVLDRIRTISGKDFEFIEADLCCKRQTAEIFKGRIIDAVIHFAGLKAVGESVEKPLEYYTNNLVSTINLLGEMKKHSVKNLVFSSSATVYGEPETVPIPETAATHVSNPYGATKLMIEDMLRDIAAADKSMNIALLRYFNPIGADPSGLIGEDPNGIPNNLLPFITQVAIGRLEKLSVYGNDYNTPDGTGVRDYIHVVDLARGHIAALKKLNTNCGLVTYNLGTGHGCSVLDVVHAFENATGEKIPYRIAPRRPGDCASCYADPTKAREELGFTAERGIEEMCADSWHFQQKNPNGYTEKPVLVILAAGMGSRYGGCKQIDPMGAHGELIIDYSIYDAKRAGFETVIFLIKRGIEQDFKEAIGDRISKYMKVEYAYQELDMLPDGMTAPDGRTKPYGTTHALLCCEKAVAGRPFCVINSDDYYGPDAYKTVYDYLTNAASPRCHAMVGYELGNTLSARGTVTRGICAADSNGHLTGIEEHFLIAEKDGVITAENGKKQTVVLKRDDIASMNFWGFMPDIFDDFREDFADFLNNVLPTQPEKAECLLPNSVALALRRGASVSVLHSSDRWHGVTHKDDKPEVVAAFASLTEKGVYPSPLWK